jgi:hypothetical protein
MSAISADIITPKNAQYISINKVRTPVYSWEVANKQYVDGAIPNANGTNPGVISGVAQTLGGALTLTAPLTAGLVYASNIDNPSSTSFNTQITGLWASPLPATSDTVTIYAEGSTTAILHYIPSGTTQGTVNATGPSFGTTVPIPSAFIPQSSQCCVITAYNNGAVVPATATVGTNGIIGITAITGNFTGVSGLVQSGFTFVYALI